MLKIYYKTEKDSSGHSKSIRTWFDTPTTPCFCSWTSSLSCNSRTLFYSAIFLSRCEITVYFIIIRNTKWSIQLNIAWLYKLNKYLMTSTLRCYLLKYMNSHHWDAILARQNIIFHSKPNRDYATSQIIRNVDWFNRTKNLEFSKKIF